MLLSLRIIWGWEAAARLKSIRARFTSSGLPLTTADFAGPPLADDQNAAVALTAALGSLRVEAPDFGGRGEGRGRGGMAGMGWGWGRLSMMDGGRWRPTVTANREALAEIDHAIMLPAARWPMTTESIWDRPPNASMSLGNFGLRVLLRAAAQAAHDDGQDAAAIAALRRTLAVAHILDSSNDLLSHVAAAGMRSEAAQLLERWDLQPTPATAGAMRDLIKAFVEGSANAPNIARSFEFETAAYAESAAGDDPALQNWWLRPLAIDGIARGMALQVKLLPVVQATNWQQVAATPLPLPAAHTNLNTIVLSLSEPRLEIVEVMRIYFRSLADMRAVSVLAAANLYRAEKGAYPPTIEALVPTYLAVVPVDPFEATGKGFHYRLDGKGADISPTVWSVGENGIDDGGAFPSFAGMSMGGGPGWGGGGGGGGGPAGGGGGFGLVRRYGQLDLVYGNGWRIALAAATAP